MASGVFETLPDRPLAEGELGEVASRVAAHFELEDVSTCVAEVRHRLVAVRIYDRRRSIAYLVGYHPDGMGWELIDIWAEREYSTDLVEVALVQWADRRYPGTPLRHAVPPLPVGEDE